MKYLKSISLMKIHKTDHTGVRKHILLGPVILFRNVSYRSRHILCSSAQKYKYKDVSYTTVIMNDWKQGKYP